MAGVTKTMVDQVDHTRTLCYRSGCRLVTN